MCYEKILQAQDVIIGTKQTLRALEEEIVSKVIIARDAELRVISKVEQLANAKGIQLEYADSMKQLGKACKIEVGAATVAIRM